MIQSYRPARHRIQKHIRRSAGGLAVWLVASSAWAQSGGRYDLRWNTIDGGGATFSSGGQYTLGATIGQPDAAGLSGETYRLAGGFWRGIFPSVTPPTGTPAPTATGTRAGTPATPTSTQAPTATATRVTTQAPTTTAATPPPHNATATPTQPLSTCFGDCDGDGQVTVDDLLTMLSVALGQVLEVDCQGGDNDNNGETTVDEVVIGVNNALSGCLGAGLVEQRGAAWGVN